MFVSGDTIKSIIYSIFLHAAALALLIISFGATPVAIKPTVKNVEVINAVAVDNKQVEAELQRLKEVENAKQKKQKELEKKLQDLQQKTARAEEQRKAEETRLANLKKQKAEEEKKRKQEQEKLAVLKKQKEELEKQRKIEEERKRKEELERKRNAEEQRQREEERKRKAEEQRKREEERKRKAAEAALQKQLAEDQRRQDQALLQQTVNGIYRRVANNFNLTGLPAGLEAVLSIRLIPGGEVINVTINKSSGNDIFDRRAITAVQKASPLPVPQDAATFERLGLRQFNLVFKPQ